MQPLSYESHSTARRFWSRWPWWGRAILFGAVLWVGGVAAYNVVLACVFFFVFGFDALRPHPLTTSLQSPDAAWIAELREVPAMVDRNFEVIVRERRTGRAKKILDRSPDEGPPGTERFVWSVDSKRLLLVGSNFTGTTMKAPTTGEQVYLLYDTRDGTLRCNSPQASLPPINTDDLAGFSFTPPTTAPVNPPAPPGSRRF